MCVVCSASDRNFTQHSTVEDQSRLPGLVSEDGIFVSPSNTQASTQNLAINHVNTDIHTQTNIPTSTQNWACIHTNNQTSTHTQTKNKQPNHQPKSRTFQKTYTIYFKINKYSIDLTYKGNAATIRRMQAEIDSLLARDIITTDSIAIISAASPDGRSAYNNYLARRRGEAAKNLLQKKYPGIDTEIICIDPIGEDWGTFRKIAYSDPDIPDREKLIELIESDLDNEAKEARLRQMKATFRYIVTNHVYLMRSSSVTFRISMPLIAVEPLEHEIPLPMYELPLYDIRHRDPEAKAATDAVPTPETLTAKPAEAGTQKAGQKEKKTILAARTNLLVPALNVGLEVPVGNNWSIGADYYFPWWLAKNNRYCIEMLGWFLDTKYWFGKDRTDAEKLTGHALGAYAGAGYYDFQWEKSGNQGEYIDIGIDYTFAIPVAKNKLRMEFNLGLGWLHTIARHYTPTDDYSELIKDPGIKHRKHNFIGPTRASISFVVPIRAKVKAKKGGNR